MSCRSPVRHPRNASARGTPWSSKFMMLNSGMLPDCSQQPTSGFPLNLLMYTSVTLPACGCFANQQMTPLFCNLLRNVTECITIPVRSATSLYSVGATNWYSFATASLISRCRASSSLVWLLLSSCTFCAYSSICFANSAVIVGSKSISSFHVLPVRFASDAASIGVGADRSHKSK